jgi:hypothetical protein
VTTTLTGSASAVNRTAPSTTAPVDGEANSAASMNDQIQAILNEIAMLKASVAFINEVATNTAGTATKSGLKAVGNTTGPGLHGTGGASSGPGVEGVGGASNGVGVKGTGQGTGAGVSGTGGGSNGVGVLGTGNGTGAGVSGLGSAGGSPGVEGFGAVGVRGLADGTGTGVVAAGNASGATPLHAFNNVGGAAVDVARVDGYINLDNAVDPSSSTNYGDNRVVPALVCKAWGFIKCDTNAVHDGVNISSVANSATIASDKRITFVRPMANDDYCVLLTAHSGEVFLNVADKSASWFDVSAAAATDGSSLDLGTQTLEFYFAVFGRQ